MIRVVFQPVADLVLGRENRPVVGELHVGQVVVPDRIVQVEGLVALTPGVTRALILFDDDGGHSEPPQPRAQPDPALAAADDDGVGLVFVAEPRLLLLLQFQPGFTAFGDLVGDPLVPVGALLFLKALQFLHGGEQGPAFAIPEAQMGVAPGLGGLEVHPGLGIGGVPGGVLGEGPVAGPHVVQGRLEHAPDVLFALQRLEVPGEGDEVAPVRVVVEKFQCGVSVVAAQCLIELRQPRPDDAVWCLRHVSSFHC